MVKTTASVKLAFAALSLSFIATSTTTTTTTTSTFASPLSFFKSQLKVKPQPTSSSSSLHLTKPVKATTSDLLNILGPVEQSSSVNTQLAQQLFSCFKFLVPFSPTPSRRPTESTSTRRSLSSGIIDTSSTEGVDDELIWWPPPPVMDLARLAIDSGGDPGSIQRALDPIPITVPDVEGSNEFQCQLTRTPYGRRFINEELNSYLEFLFKVIVERGPSIGLNVSLNRYDLFHGHLFIAVESRRLGILFHAKEYPAYNKKVFPYNMGYCQIGSDVEYDDEMNLRNILWLAPLPSNASKEWLAPGVLVVLDAHPGGIIYRDLIPQYVHIARTLYEDDFGEVVVDVNFLNVGDDKVPNFQIFIC